MFPCFHYSCLAKLLLPIFQAGMGSIPYQILSKKINKHISKLKNYSLKQGMLWLQVFFSTENRKAIKK